MATATFPESIRDRFVDLHLITPGHAVRSAQVRSRSAVLTVCPLLQPASSNPDSARRRGQEPLPTVADIHAHHRRSGHPRSGVTWCQRGGMSETRTRCDHDNRPSPRPNSKKPKPHVGPASVGQSSPAVRRGPWHRRTRAQTTKRDLRGRVLGTRTTWRNPQNRPQRPDESASWPGSTGQAPAMRLSMWSMTITCSCCGLNRTISASALTRTLWPGGQ